jgi:hypothetical protein
MRICKSPECRKPYHAKGYCGKHYKRMRSWGSLTLPERPSHHYLFATWESMRQRCVNVKSPNYNNYGGRGITVCDRWLEPKGKGFWNFVNDMGERPKGMSLDRTNNDGNYEPSNCRWATATQQVANRRPYITYDFSMIEEDFDWK